jgi:hypothetical protein
MFENSYSKVGLSKLLYTDTDASKFRYSDFINWKKWVDDNNVIVPHWKEVEAYDDRYSSGHKIFETNSKVYGSFEDELDGLDGDEYIFYCIEKKSWLYAYCKNNKWDGKFRFKGINENSLMITLNEDFISKKVIKHKATKDKKAWEEEYYYIPPKSEEEVYKYYSSNKNLSFNKKSFEGMNNAIKFFKQIYETGEGYVLSQSFRKIVKNLSRNVDIDNEDKYNDLINKIQVNITLKHINIKKNI